MRPAAVRAAGGSGSGSGSGSAAGPLLVAAVPLAAVAVLAEIAYPLVHGQLRDAVTVVTVLAFFAASTAHAAATRGARCAAALVGVTASGGLLAEWVGTRTGWPFGGYAYTGGLGPTVAGVPAVIPLAWTMMAWPGYLAASRLVGHRPRPARVALAGWALASWDLFLDPQMVAAGHWRWLHPSAGLPGVPGVPLSNYLGWVAVSVLLMAGVDLLTGAGRPHRAGPDRRDAVPFSLYLWTYGSSVLAHAAFFGLAGSAAWGAVGMGAVAVPLAVALARSSRRSARRTVPA